MTPHEQSIAVILDLLGFKVQRAIDYHGHAIYSIKNGCCKNCMIHIPV